MNPYDIGPILKRITGAAPGASDIIFSPLQVPHLIKDGSVVAVPIKDFRKLTPYQTEVLALNLLSERPSQLATFIRTGSVVFSVTLKRVGYFRVSVFRQREMVAIVMRIVPLQPPTIESLGLPQSLVAISELRGGLVVFSGPSDSGKTTTLAATVQQLNRAYPYHVITIENPIEFVYTPERAMIHQIEVGSDAPDFPTAIEAARQQSPRILVVSEIRDAATAEAVLATAEAGILVLTTVAAESTFAALHALLRWSPVDRADSFRNRLAAATRYIVSQKLFCRQNGNGRIAALEILKTNSSVREFIQRGAPSADVLAELLRKGEAQGMQLLATDIQRIVKEGYVARATAGTGDIAPATMPGVSAGQEPRELEIGNARVLDMNLTT